MQMTRCQAVAATREIIEITFVLHQKLHNKEKRTKVWTIDIFFKFFNLKNLSSAGKRTAQLYTERFTRP